MTTKTFPLSGPTSLQLRVDSGSLTVHARDGLTEASVTMAPRVTDSDIVDRTLVELRGSTLHVIAPRQRGIFDLPILGKRQHNRSAMDVTVTVPSGSAVKATTFTADIAVDGRCGTAEIASGSSTISLEEVEGDLRLRYGSSNCHVGRVSGSVELRSGSGDARFGEIGGELSSGRGSGELDATAVHGRVRTRSGSGRTTLRAVHSDVDLASGSGELAIGIPAGQPARLDMVTGSGQVDSELPVEEKPATSDDAIMIRAKTGSGDIRLFRAT
ncbi:MAG: DUF4097 family beta strand repeat-containing protein [Solirubrobacteraceae bacterium]|nr:MAG: hypothetical protein DLM63_13395 [Solirubrobacterales bacterium]